MFADYFIFIILDWMRRENARGKRRLVEIAVKAPMRRIDRMWRFDFARNGAMHLMVPDKICLSATGACKHETVKSIFFVTYYLDLSHWPPPTQGRT